MAKSRKRGKRSADAFVKQYNPPPIKLSRRYEALREEEIYSEADDNRPFRSNTALQSGYTSDDGMYKNLHKSPCEERDSRLHRGGRVERGRQVGGRSRRQERVEEQELDSSGRRQGRERERESESWTAGSGIAKRGRGGEEREKKRERVGQGS